MISYSNLGNRLVNIKFKTKCVHIIGHERYLGRSFEVNIFSVRLIVDYEGNVDDDNLPLVLSKSGNFSPYV